ncbi:MAG TPA: TetR family transcriptional regulator [Baekduia sp.]|nr:TetR family transcriptional regulator [Baekduia sp.]
MSTNTCGVSNEAVELDALPVQAQAFHRRARIVDAAVREIAEHGFEQAAVRAIAERAGVSLRAFYSTFDGKEDALIWAYDVAAAYAIPQILRAIQAERDWERGAAAALGAYLAILDCDRDWAVACLRDVPAAGERVRAARDAVRAPILKALETQGAAPAAVGVGTILTAIDAITVDGLRHAPDQPLLARKRELTAFALAPFVDAPDAVAPRAAPSIRPSSPAEEIEGLLDDGPTGVGALELVVQEAASMRDGPTLWRVIVAVQRRRAGTGDDIERLALDALGRAWFFGLALDQPDEGADVRYLRFVAAHPGCSGAEVQRGLGVRHLSQVNRKLRRLEAAGYVRREAGPGPANHWWPAGEHG